MKMIFDNKIIINNKEITTNYNEYIVGTLEEGTEINGYDLYYKSERENKDDFFNRLVEYGYTYIKFYKMTSGADVELVAYCKGLEEKNIGII